MMYGHLTLSTTAEDITAIIPFLSSEKIIPLSDLYPAPAFPKVTGEMTA